MINNEEINAFPITPKHEYLLRDDFYEMNSIGTRARSDKYCTHCGKVITKGTPHLMAKFYPEFAGYALHEECEENFMKSLNEDKDKSPF